MSLLAWCIPIACGAAPAGGFGAVSLAAVVETEQRVFEWLGMPAGWMRVLAALGLFGACTLVIWLYRAERRSGTRAGVRGTLAALRCLFLVGLALLWLEPAIATYVVRSISAQVAVLVDASASMSALDVETPGGAAGSSTTSSAVPPTRWAAVRQRLTADDDGWLKRLAERNDLSLYAFGEETARVRLPWESPPAPASGAAPARSDRTSLESVSPTQARTDFGQAVAAALNDIGNSPVAGVVLLTDGAVNQGLSADELVALAKRFKAPLYTVGVGSAREPVNLRITSLAAPDVVPPGDPFAVRVEVAAAGVEPTEVEVELSAGPTTASPGENETRVGVRRVQVGEGLAPAVVQFEVNPPAPGEYTYRARVAPLPGEALADDNVRETTVRVLDELLRVLIVAGGPSYEYLALTRLLERDKTIDVSCWLQSADERALRDGRTPIAHLPREPAELFAYDAVLLLDPDPAELDASWAVTLRRWVDELGGGVLLEAGPQLTTRFLRDPRLQELVSILPVTPDPDADMRLSTLGTYRREPSALQLPLQVAGHPLVALNAEAATNREIWAALPGVWWYLPVLRAKPVATVLLETARPGGRAAPAGDANVLMAAQQVGAGRAAFLGFSSTWRWRATAEPYFNRFWVQLVRYLSHARRQATSRRGSLVLDRESFNVGDYVKIEARLLDRSFAPWHEPQVHATLEWADGTIVDFVLAATVGREGWFDGRLLLSRVGAAVLRVPLPDAGASGGQAAEFLTKRLLVQRPDAEMRALRLREDVLTSLADQTGGQYCRLAESDNLPDRVRKAGERKPPQRTLAEPLWDNSYVLAALAVLLTVEWALRRKHHLL